MADARQSLGRIGEDLACRELARLGYAILARRYRGAGGELDIVARDGGDLVFVEVKTRDSREYGDAAEAVTSRKQRRIVHAAMDYMLRYAGGECACRFDVVSIVFGGHEPLIEVYRSAFDASGR